MPKIFAPVEGFTGTVVGVNFVEGAGETDDVIALAYFERQGYRIEQEEIPADKPVSKMTKNELIAYAGEHGIEIDASAKVDTIRATISATNQPETAQEQTPADEQPQAEEVAEEE